MGLACCPGLGLSVTPEPPACCSNPAIRTDPSLTTAQNYHGGLLSGEPTAATSPRSLSSFLQPRGDSNIMAEGLYPAPHSSTPPPQVFCQRKLSGSASHGAPLTAEVGVVCCVHPVPGLLRLSCFNLAVSSLQKTNSADLGLSRGALG